MSGRRKAPSPSLSAVLPTKRPKKVKKTNYEIDSDDSTPEVVQNAPSPINEECMPRLPEDLIQSITKTPGVLLIAGMVSWDSVGKRVSPEDLQHPNLYTFRRFTDMKYRLAVSSCSAAHSVLISENGEAYTFGRNNCGQLGFGDNNTRYVPELIPALEGQQIIHAACGRNHTLFATDKGSVYACGDNKSGQCGIGTTATKQVLKPTRIKYNGPPIIRVGCGAEFSMILDISGRLHSFGLPEYGQLGHNSDGKFFVTSTKLSFHFETIPKAIEFYYEKTKDGRVAPIRDVEIVDFACGNNHTVAIDSKRRAYSWGFGGFGRLGHAEQKDESVPRLIRCFDTQSGIRGVRSVFCGATFSMAINDIGALFLFGQTKRTGEANMYPKPVQDLSGWNVRSVGTSNTSIVIAADDSIIVWGVSPTYGELGIGDITKSTAKPKEVNRLEGINVTHVTMGFSHTLLLCDDSVDEVKAKLHSLSVFKP